MIVIHFTSGAQLEINDDGIIKKLEELIKSKTLDTAYQAFADKPDKIRLLLNFENVTFISFNDEIEKVKA
jgi:hypothetical protein